MCGKYIAIHELNMNTYHLDAYSLYGISTYIGYREPSMRLDNLLFNLLAVIILRVSMMFHYHFDVLINCGL